MVITDRSVVDALRAAGHSALEIQAYLQERAAEHSHKPKLHDEFVKAALTGILARAGGAEADQVVADAYRIAREVLRVRGGG